MASRSLNKVQLIGNLTRDPELRYTPQGTAVCSFGMATNRSWLTDAGEKREETEFHRVVAWNKLAELCAQLLFKGRKVFTEGRLQTRQWTAQDGTPRQTTEVIISEMIILDSKRQPGEVARGNVYGEPAPLEENSRVVATGEEKKAVGKAGGAKEENGAVPGKKGPALSAAGVNDDDQAQVADDQQETTKPRQREDKDERDEFKAEDIPF